MLLLDLFLLNGTVTVHWWLWIAYLIGTWGTIIFLVNRLHRTRARWEEDKHFANECSKAGIKFHLWEEGEPQNANDAMRLNHEKGTNF